MPYGEAFVTAGHLVMEAILNATYLLLCYICLTATAVYYLVIHSVKSETASSSLCLMKVNYTSKVQSPIYCR